jgi:hypothetical protein
MRYMASPFPIAKTTDGFGKRSCMSQIDLREQATEVTIGLVMRRHVDGQQLYTAAIKDVDMAVGLFNAPWRRKTLANACHASW